MYRFLILLPMLSCSVGPINQIEKQAEEEESLYPNGYQFGELVIDPGALDFGNVTLNSTQTEELLFVNTGSSAISIVSASIEGDSVFSLESSFLNFELESGDEEIVNVRFTPREEKSYEASLSVLISTESSAGEVEITGLGGASEGGEPAEEPSQEQADGGLQFDTIVHDYGQIPIQATSAFVFNVSNVTGSPISITGITSSNSAFSVSPYSNVKDGETISANITRTMTINFKPTQMIAYSGTITVLTDSAETPQIELDLSGEGICQTCSPRITIDGLSSPYKASVFQAGDKDLFGFPLWSEPNPKTQSITLKNEGDQDLVITNIQIENDQTQPDYSGDFSTCGTDGVFTLISTNLPITVTPGSTTSVSVQFEYVSSNGGNCNDCYFPDLSFLGLPFGGVSDDSADFFGAGIVNYTKMTIQSNDNTGDYIVFLGAEVGVIP